jgi:hypothetical protein
MAMCAKVETLQEHATFATFHNACGLTSVWSRSKKVFATSALRGTCEVQTMICNASKFDTIVLEFDTCFYGHGHQNQHRDNNKCCSNYYHSHKQFYTRESIFDNYNNQ